jgi:glycine/D-amino acid oxidase-like deaminating enzyme
MLLSRCDRLFAKESSRSSLSAVRRAQNGGISFWISDIGGPPAHRPPLTASIHADVCIVGAGFSGLWTAYYLAKHAPRLKIVILEREFAGFGASGRNGGNMSIGTWPRNAYATHGTAAAITALDRLLADTPREIMRIAKEEGIEADFVTGGNLQVATTPEQGVRLKATYRALSERFGSVGDVKLVSRAQVLERVRISDVVGGIVFSLSTRIQPAKLVRGLSDAVERMGIRIYEATEVSALQPRAVFTSAGFRVDADVVVRATEGFTPELPGFHRQLVPLNSAMIVTDIVPDEIMKEIGWEGYETISETSYLFSYCQRTSGNRITLGGRGVPYRFGSKLDKHGATDLRTVTMLHQCVERLFPQLKNVPIAHAWCGPLGTPRDWRARVNYDPSTGFGWLGGYVGGGISPSNLAGRTMADLILGKRSELTALPWINIPAKQWELEPVRWIAIKTMYKLYGIADQIERRGGDGSWLAHIVDKITGRD